MLATEADTPAGRACPASAKAVACRRCLAGLVLGGCALVLLRALVLEPYQVPTGSMAPALRGHHRVCACPRCGASVVVGRHPADADGQAGQRRYDKAFCPNCGKSPLPLGDVPETCGDQVLVNKLAFALREPRRWEVVVFRLFGITFIKRVIGLPGETVEVCDGDVYLDGMLARKAFAQGREMRVLVFDSKHGPEQVRWEGGDDDELSVDGRASPRTLTYRHFLLDEEKCEPVRDESSYNGGLHAGREDVHDFHAEAVVEVRAGQGTVTLRLCDGQDWVEAALPVQRAGEVVVRSCPMHSGTPERERRGGSLALRPGQTARVELAFVDRRLTLCVDGRLVHEADWPAPGRRRGVVRPFQLQADGVSLRLREFRLYRDVHYGQRGTNAVGGKAVHLGAEQYFVMGDNSPNSEDSRFWPDRGAVPAASLRGRPFLVHWPSRLSGGWQLPDAERVRWLR